MGPPSTAAEPFALPVHGGDLSAADARFGRPADGWLDLSTAISPFSYPVPPLDPAIWERLPDRSLENALRAAAADFYGAASAEQVVAAVRPGDVVITMGAGDVTLLGPEIISALHAKAESRRLS